MVVQCPQCLAKLDVPSLPSADTPVRCPRCEAVFRGAPEPVEAVALAEPVPEAEPAPQQADDFEFDDAPAEPARPKPRAPRAPEKKFPTLAVVAGLVAVVSVAGLVVVLTSGGKKPQVADNTPVEPPRKDQPKKDAPKKEQPPQKPRMPPEFAEVFAAGADRPAPTALVPTLQRVGRDELLVPAFAAKAAAPGGDGKMTLDEIKKATAFLRIAAGDVLGSGSGFVIRADGDGALLATNYHVVHPRAADPAATPRVTAVFDSGLPTESEAAAEVVATDPEIDLALLRIARTERTPKPIEPAFAPKLTETMEVRICGFPFGAALASGTRNPNITIGKGTVSSIRLNAAGRVEKVQLDGAVNPGNSGGPIVDADGRLVGVAVATIRGSGIGMAIPAAELNAMLAGRVSPPAVLADGVADGRAAFKVLAPVADPLGRVKGVALHVRTGEKPTESERDEGGKWKPLAGASRVELKLGARAAEGEFRVAAPAEGKKSLVVLQLECRDADGVAVFSPPVSHQLVLSAVQTASDAIPMATFRRGLPGFAGQVVVVRGKLAAGTTRRGTVYELRVKDEDDSAPDGLAFVAGRDVVAQLNEVFPEDFALPVRLTLRVGKLVPGGATPARVARVDFIGRANRLVKTIPSAEGPDDLLAGMNRDPEQFTGQTLTFVALVEAVVRGRDAEPELSLLLVSEQAPEHLYFTSGQSLAAGLKDPALHGEVHVARVTARVENREVDQTGQRVITVLKVELVGRDGRPTRTLE